MTDSEVVESQQDKVWDTGSPTRNSDALVQEEY